MIGVVAYLLLVVFVALFCLVRVFVIGFVPPLNFAEPVVTSALIGTVGGGLYCLRAVYLNACVHSRWSAQWLPWYFIRPITSTISGGISYVFLYAGLLVLDSVPDAETSRYGFYALAFIAGLNVDKFVAKIEDIALTTWGIDRSRVAGGERTNGTVEINPPGPSAAREG